MRKVTTKINRADRSTREDIGVTMNTSSVPSYTPIKSEYGDLKDFLPATSGIQVMETGIPLDPSNELLSSVW